MHKVLQVIRARVKKPLASSAAVLSDELTSSIRDLLD